MISDEKMLELLDDLKEAEKFMLKCKKVRDDDNFWGAVAGEINSKCQSQTFRESLFFAILTEISKYKDD